MKVVLSDKEQMVLVALYTSPVSLAVDDLAEVVNVTPEDAQRMLDRLVKLNMIDKMEVPFGDCGTQLQN